MQVTTKEIMSIIPFQIGKGSVARLRYNIIHHRENKELTLIHVQKLFRERCAEISSTICKKCIEHVKHVEDLQWKTDRIVDAELEK